MLKLEILCYWEYMLQKEIGDRLWFMFHIYYLVFKNEKIRHMNQYNILGDMDYIPVSFFLYCVKVSVIKIKYENTK
jgi:uncharacterized membrane protein